MGSPLNQITVQVQWYPQSKHASVAHILQSRQQAFERQCVANTHSRKRSADPVCCLGRNKKSYTGYCLIKKILKDCSSKWRRPGFSYHRFCSLINSKANTEHLIVSWHNNSHKASSTNGVLYVICVFVIYFYVHLSTCLIWSIKWFILNLVN